MIDSTIYRISAFSLGLALFGCGTVVEPVRIPNLSPNSALQEELEVDPVPLTLQVAKQLNLQGFERKVSLPGSAFSADLVSENQISRNKFPPSPKSFTYKLGIGDVISFAQAEENDFSLSPTNGGSGLNALMPNVTGAETGSTSAFNFFENNRNQAKLTLTSSRVSSDGSVLLLGVGRLEAAGRQIIDLREEVRSILIKNGKVPNFQLEITAFNSQKIYLTTDSPSNEQRIIGFVLAITDRGATLRQLLASAGIPFDEKVLTVVKIQREGETFSFTLADLYSESAPDIYLKDKDHIFIQSLSYRNGKVFLVGGVKPQMLNILPEERQTLAEVLFAPSGPLAEPTAQRSAIYLLRGQNPIKAYHLDAQNPTRLLVANTVELRPNDIVFVGEQPINTFNRVLATIFPLRILSRDIQNDNVP